jgi:hypothetical protein
MRAATTSAVAAWLVTQAGPLVGATIASMWFAASAESIALRAAVVAVVHSWM